MPLWEANAAWNSSKSCIHSSAKSWGWTSVLLNTKINGSFVLYRMLRAEVRIWYIPWNDARGCQKYFATKHKDSHSEKYISTYLQAYSIFDMKVAGAVVRGVSIMYAITVGRDDATASVMMTPDADQVKISICPGVSSIT